MPAPAATTERVSAADSPSVCSPAAAAHVCDCDVRDGRRDREASTHTHKSTTLVCTIPYNDILYSTYGRCLGARLVQCTWLEYCCLYSILLYCAHTVLHKAKKTTRGRAGFFISAHHLCGLSRANQYVRSCSTRICAQIADVSLARFSQAHRKKNAEG